MKTLAAWVNALLFLLIMFAATAGLVGLWIGLVERVAGWAS